MKFPSAPSQVHIHLMSSAHESGELDVSDGGHLSKSNNFFLSPSTTSSTHAANILRSFDKTHLPSAALSPGFSPLNSLLDVQGLPPSAGSIYLQERRQLVEQRLRQLYLQSEVVDADFAALFHPQNDDKLSLTASLAAPGALPKPISLNPSSVSGQSKYHPHVVGSVDDSSRAIPKFSAAIGSQPAETSGSCLSWPAATRSAVTTEQEATDCHAVSRHLSNENAPSVRQQQEGFVASPYQGKENFPWKLYRMLEETEACGRQDIVSFVGAGNAFRIHKPRAFEEEVMPKYFTTHRITSFQRQLNTYGFQRMVGGSHHGAYRHPFFLRSNPNVMDKMVRAKRPKRSKKVDGKGTVSKNDNIGSEGSHSS